MIIYRTYRAHCARYIPNLDDSHICRQMHGHTFNITIFLDGPINDKSGFVMDFYELDKIINDIKGIDPFKRTLGGCIIEKVHQTVILSKES